MDILREQLIIRQQIALNSKMYETEKISKHLYHRTDAILMEKLTNALNHDIISHSKIM